MNVLCNVWDTFTPQISVTLKVIVIINHGIIV